MDGTTRTRSRLRAVWRAAAMVAHALLLLLLVLLIVFVVVLVRPCRDGCPDAAAYGVTAVDGVAYGLVLFVVAAGLTLIFGVMGVLNLAHGTFFLAGGYLAYLAHRHGGGSLAGLGVALAVGVLAGAGGGAALATAIRPLTGRPSHAGHTGRLSDGHLPQALATLGIAYLAADAYTSLFGGAPVPIDPPHVLAGSIDLGRHGYPVYRLLFIAVATLIALGLHLLVARSRYGILLRAAVADPAMAAATGVNVRAVQTTAIAGGGVLAVLGGVLAAPLIGPSPGTDTTVLVLSLIVVVIGSAGQLGSSAGGAGGAGGSIPGTLAAALLVGQVQTVGVLAAPTLAPFALFAVLLGVLLVRSRTSVRPA
ncbi:branched-chain amino acid ABC transporter permease [Dactylosporangium sp. AC04546]|uniref:branched-chain amino acid ABC transporter permease n=1 Tax=Dactylosporangium sp. AC04546 TaxID=2862460 RepID=UPI001EDE2CF1|nr:branched-chain amino acid ABC transporter permease [Dactylosporangium sp. AC04546]WVK78887.1 branched-chain amino acid ABC transporter permease [Dactylosporangium sp. AC04546]